MLSITRLYGPALAWGTRTVWQKSAISCGSVAGLVGYEDKILVRDQALSTGIWSSTPHPQPPNLASLRLRISSMLTSSRVVWAVSPLTPSASVSVSVSVSVSASLSSTV